MNFELPLSNLAMEIAGTAARAVGACHTLTMADESMLDTDELMLAAAGGSRESARSASFSVALDPQPTVTVTF